MLRIKLLRQEREISQRALAEKIGASQKSIDYWEKGKAEPTAHFICALADYFECSADYLLGREDDYGNVSVSYSLSPLEQQLLLSFSSIPKDEQKTLLRFAEFLETKKGS